MNYKNSLFSLTFIVFCFFSYLYYAAFFARTDGCSSWIAFGPAVENGETEILMHKNRDMLPVLKNGEFDNDMVFHEIENGLYRYMASGADVSYDEDVSNSNVNREIWDSLNIWTGVNEKGLAVCSNFVAGTIWWGPYKGPDACREILENCASVEEAGDWLQQNKLRFASGALIFVSDLKGGAIFEVSQQYNFWEWPCGIKISDDASAEIDPSKGIGFGTNHYEFFENSIFEPQILTTDSLGRYEFLRRSISYDAGTYYGEITADICNLLSSKYPINRKLWFYNNFLFNRTLGATTVKVVKDNPLESILYFADGYPTTDDDTYVTLHEAHYETYYFSDIHTIPYGFEGILQDDDENNVYVCDIYTSDIETDSLVLQSQVELDDEEYETIAEPYNGSVECGRVRSFKRRAVYFEMKIDEDAEDIDSIDFIFQGIASERNDFLIYVKSVNDNSFWLKLGNETTFFSNTNDVIRRRLYDNIADFIDDDGRISWAVVATDNREKLLLTHAKMEVILN